MYVHTQVSLSYVRAGGNLPLVKVTHTPPSRSMSQRYVDYKTTPCTQGTCDAKHDQKALFAHLSKLASLRNLAYGTSCSDALSWFREALPVGPLFGISRDVEFSKPHLRTKLIIGIFMHTLEKAGIFFSFFYTHGEAGETFASSFTRKWFA